MLIDHLTDDIRHRLIRRPDTDCSRCPVLDLVNSTLHRSVLFLVNLGNQLGLFCRFPVNSLPFPFLFLDRSNPVPFRLFRRAVNFPLLQQCGTGGIAFSRLFLPQSFPFLCPSFPFRFRLCPSRRPCRFRRIAKRPALFLGLFAFRLPLFVPLSHQGGAFGVPLCPVGLSFCVSSFPAGFVFCLLFRPRGFLGFADGFAFCVPSFPFCPAAFVTDRSLGSSFLFPFLASGFGGGLSFPLRLFFRFLGCRFRTVFCLGDFVVQLFVLLLQRGNCFFRVCRIPDELCLNNTLGH